jgi:mRNA (guanine-N7-)-methyltransferase
MHYAFESETKVRTMLDNVTKYLRPGGRFIGTTPNAEILLYATLSSVLAALTISCRSSLADARRKDPNTLKFGNNVYNVHFDSSTPSTYGHRYMFFLADAVENVPEYVVYWKNFVK